MINRKAKGNKYAAEIARKSLMIELQISAYFKFTKILLIKAQPQEQNSMGYMANTLSS